MTPELVIFMGLQGSGKSSFYRSRFMTTHDLISKDLLRNNRQPARRQQHLLQNSLSGGRSVVVDNTNPTREERAGLISQGRAFGAWIVGYFFSVAPG